MSKESIAGPWSSTQTTPTTEIMDKLFLELSQFTTAKTARDIANEKRIAELEERLRVEQSCNRCGQYHGKEPCADIAELEAEKKALIDSGWRACVDHIIKPDSPCPVCRIEELKAKLGRIQDALVGELRNLLPRWREGDFDLPPYVKGKMDGCHQCADELEAVINGELGADTDVKSS